MKFRSSVVSTRLLALCDPTRAFPHFRMIAATAFLAMLMTATSVAFAGSNTIVALSGNNQFGAPGTTLPDPLTIEYRDSGGAPISGGSNIVYTVISGNATLNGGQTSVPVSTDSFGRASVTAAFTGTTNSDVVVRAGEVSGAQVNFTLFARVPVIAVLAGNGQTLSPDQTAPIPLQVDVKFGVGGPPEPGATLRFQVISGDAFVDAGFGQGTEANATTDSNGRASVTLTAGSRPGPVQIEVSRPSNPTVAPVSFTATIVGSPALTVISGDNQGAAPGAAFAAPVVIEASDGAGNIAAGVPVTFQITQGDATFSNGQLSFTTSTLDDGRAQASLVAGMAEGNVFVRVSAVGYTPADFFLFVDDGRFGFVQVISGAPQSTDPNTPFPVPLVVEVREFQPQKSTPVPNGSTVPVPNVPVTLAISTGNAVFAANGLASIVLTTNTGGQVSAAINATSPKGEVLINISTQDYGTANATLLITGSSGEIQTENGDFQNQMPGETSDPLTALVLDSSGVPVSGVPVTFSVLPGITPPTGITFTPSQATSDVSGRVSFVINTTAETPNGDFRIQAASPGYTPAVFNYGVSDKPPSDASFDKIGGDNQTGSTGTNLPSPLAVQAFASLDQQERGGFSGRTPIEGLIVTWRVASGAASVVDSSGIPRASTTVPTDANGISSVNVRPSDPGGPFTIEASAIIEGQPYTELFSGTGNSVPSTITITGGNNQSGAANTTLPDPLTIQLRDGNGQPVVGASVIYTVQSGTATFANGQTTFFTGSDSSGNAMATVILGATAGPVRIVAEALGIGSVVFDLTIADPVPPATLTIVSGNNQNGSPGSLSQPLVVELIRNGAPGSGETLNWFVRAGDAQLENPSTVTGPDGRASNRITFGPTLGQIVVEAQTPGGALAVQFILNSAAGAGVNDIRLVSGGGQAGLPNTPFAAPLVFEVTNSQGAVQPGVLVTFAVAQGSATINNNTATTDANGRVSLTGSYGATPGAIQIRASIGSGAQERSAFASLTTQAVALALRIVSGDAQSGQVGTTLPLPLVVEVTQTGGSSTDIVGVPLRWTVIEGGGSVTSVTTPTDAAGRASNTLRLGSQAGSNRVRVEIEGGASVTFIATATAAPIGPTARIEIVSGNNQDLATNVDSAPLVVRVVSNADGTAVANACVAFETSTVGTTVSPAQATTGTNGQAQAVARIRDIGPAIVVARLCGSTSGQVQFSLNGAIENTLGVEPGDEVFSIAQAFDNACPALRALARGGTVLNAGQTDLLARCEDLENASGVDPDDVIDALRQILSEEAEAQNVAALTVVSAQFDNLKARIAALRSGTNGSSFGGLALQGANGSVPLSFTSNALDAGSAAATDVPADEAGLSFDRWGFFAAGTIGDGDRDGDDGHAGFDFETRGITAGIDYRYSDSLVFGAALGYASNDTDINGNAGSLETTGWSISGYSTFYKGDAWYADGVLTYGSNDYDVRRNIDFTLTAPNGSISSVNQTNSASPGGDQFSAAFTAGRDFQRGAWSFGPYARFQYANVNFDGYTETVSDPALPGSGLTVSVNERELQSVQAVLAGKAAYTMSTAWGILIPHLQLEFVREFEDDPDALTSQLVFDPTNTEISVSGRDIDQSFMNLGLGLSAVFANGRSAFLYYEKLVGQEDTSRDSIAIGVRFEF